MGKRCYRPKKHKKKTKTISIVGPHRAVVLIALLRLVGAPPLVEYLVALLSVNPKYWTTACIDGCEFFCGDEELSKAFRRKRYVVPGYDIRKNKKMMDMNSTEGFITALILACCVGMAGFGHLAVVCSSFVFMSSGTSKRSIDRPQGDLREPTVRAGNKMLSRSCIVFWILRALCAWCMIEQPQGSMMQYHKRFQRILKRDIWRLHLWMGQYGAKTQKGTWLYSTHKFVDTLHKYRTNIGVHQRKASLVLRTNRHGEKQVTATKDLKASQRYPKGFGEAVRKVYQKHKRQLHREARAKLREARLVHVDLDAILNRKQKLWKEAGLKKVIKALKKK